MKKANFRTITLFTLMILGSSFFQSCDEQSLEEFNPIVSLDHEEELGKFIVQTINETNPPYLDILSKADYPASYNYFEWLLFALTNTLDISNQYDWELFIVHDDTKESIIAIPGGKLFIYTGLLKSLKSEHELFAVIAHELYFINRSPNYGEDFHSPAIDFLSEEYSRKEIVATIDQNKEENAILYFEHFLNGSYDTELINNADAFCVELICPFSYNRLGIPDVLTRVEDGLIILEEFQWLLDRPSIGIGSRIQNITDLVISCDDSEDVTEEEEAEKLMNAQKYMKELEKLP